MAQQAEVENLSNGVTLSISALAREFSVSRETVSNKLDKFNVLPSGKRRGNPIFRLRDCIPALTTSPDSGGVGDPQDLPPMERRAWYASEKDKIHTDKEKALTLPIEDHRQSLAFVIQATVQIMETLSDVLERDCDLAPDQIDRVESVVDEVRHRWADQLEAGE